MTTQEKRTGVDKHGIKFLQGCHKKRRMLYHKLSIGIVKKAKPAHPTNIKTK